MNPHTFFLNYFFGKKIFQKNNYKKKCHQKVTNLCSKKKKSMRNPGAGIFHCMAPPISLLVMNPKAENSCAVRRAKLSSRCPEQI
jgi:hypothetical protein